MLSLIVPYRHSEKMAKRLKYFLQSVEHQDVEKEIILVNYIEPYPEKIKGIKFINAKPIKFINESAVFFHQSYCNNVGALNSKGDIVLFTNADVIFAPGSFKATIEWIEKEDAFVSMFVWYSNEETWQKIESGKYDIIYNFNDILLNSELNELQAPRAAYQAISRNNFNKLGGYDVDMWGWGAEEYEFYMRVKKAGIKIIHSKKYPCVHLWHEPNWGPHHPRRGGINGLNMQAIRHKTGIWRHPLNGSYR